MGAGLLAVGILAGCAQGGAGEHRTDGAAAPTAAATIQAAGPAVQATPAVQARVAVTAASAVLAHRFRAAGLVLAPVRAGTFVRCRPGSARALYSADLLARPAARTSEAGLSARLTATLRAAGWRVTPIDLQKEHLVIATVAHPAYRMSRPGLLGALNVLPDRRAGSQALVFVESPCFTR